MTDSLNEQLEGESYAIKREVDTNQIRNQTKDSTTKHIKKQIFKITNNKNKSRKIFIRTKVSKDNKEF